MLIVVFPKVFHMSIVHCWFQMSCISGVLYKAALTYTIKARALQGEFTKWNNMTDRMEYLHMTQKVVESISKRFAIITEVFIVNYGI